MTANDIRNIALLGHGGSGKTSLAEQMLFMTKGTDRLGRTADGNTTCDYDAEEIKRQISISLAFAPVNYKGVKINVMDAPGNFDFSGEALSAIRAAECAVLVGAAKDGLSVGMERSWKMLGKKPRMIFINRTDEDNSDYQSCLDALKGKFGQAIAPIVAPVIDGNKKVTAIVDLLHNTAYEVKGGKAAACAIPADMADEVEALRAELMEAAAGADEELMEKFFDTMELSAEDMAKGLKLGVRDGSVCPVLCGSAITGLGVEMLMQTILDLVPVATDMPAEAAQDDNGNDIQVAFDPNGAAAAIVFKTISDQYGKYSMIKVIRGKVTGDVALYNPTTGNTEKLGRLYVMKGKKGEETKEICCGDIGAIGKMDRVKTGDTLCDPKNIVKLHGMDYAQPCYSRAISPKTKQEIEKLGTGLNKLNEEDPTFHVVNNAETHQTVISGAGDIQIDVLCAKLKSRFGVDAELSAPRVAYREKIRSTVRKQGRYKKQTGGSGQFGDVHIIFEPQNEQEDMIFEENVFGGSVPKNYFPAVEKGLRESCQHGVLARGVPEGHPGGRLLSPGGLLRNCLQAGCQPGLQGRSARGQARADGAHRRAEGHHSRQLSGRRDGRPEQAPGPRHGYESHRRRRAGAGGRGPHGRDDELCHRPALHDPVPRHLHLQLRPLRGLPRCGPGEGHCRGQGSGRSRIN